MVFVATVSGGYLQFCHHPVICIISLFIIFISILFTICIIIFIICIFIITSEPQPRVHESGGKYGNGIISQRYTMGQTIDIEVGTTMMIQI